MMAQTVFRTVQEHTLIYFCKMGFEIRLKKEPGAYPLPLLLETRVTSSLKSAYCLRFLSNSASAYNPVSFDVYLKMCWDSCFPVFSTGHRVAGCVASACWMPVCVCVCVCVSAGPGACALRRQVCLTWFYNSVGTGFCRGFGVWFFPFHVLASTVQFWELHQKGESHPRARAQSPSVARPSVVVNIHVFISRLQERATATQVSETQVVSALVSFRHKYFLVFF